MTCSQLRITLRFSARLLKISLRIPWVFLLGQATLGTRQLLFILVEELGIANSLTRREDHHGLQAQVQPHLLVHIRQGLDVLFHQDGDKVAVGRVFGDGHCTGLTAWWQGAAPVDIEGRLHLGKREVLAIPLESRCSIGCGLLSLLFLEGGILGASCKEIAKGAIQMTKACWRGTLETSFNQEVCFLRRVNCAEVS